MLIFDRADVPASRLPTIEEVQVILRKISQNPRMGCEALMIMEVRMELPFVSLCQLVRDLSNLTTIVTVVTSDHHCHPSFQIYPLIVKLYDVKDEDSKPRSRTLERVKSLTLRKFTGGRRPQRNLQGVAVDDVSGGGLAQFHAHVASELMALVVLEHVGCGAQPGEHQDLPGLQQDRGLCDQGASHHCCHLCHHIHGCLGSRCHHGQGALHRACIPL